MQTHASLSRHLIEEAYELVEAIDLAPTFLEALGADPAAQSHRLEGRSLMPFLTGRPPADGWRRCVFSEYDYSMLPVAAKFIPLLFSTTLS